MCDMCVLQYFIERNLCKMTFCNECLINDLPTVMIMMCTYVKMSIFKYMSIPSAMHTVSLWKKNRYCIFTLDYLFLYVHMYITSSWHQKHTETRMSINCNFWKCGYGCQYMPVLYKRNWWFQHIRIQFMFWICSEASSSKKPKLNDFAHIPWEDTPKLPQTPQFERISET